MLFYYFIIFILGLIIGSFLNCVIYRLEKEKKLTGRSYCPDCKHILEWQDLVPIFSFLFLRGRCRYCHKKISRRYPLVEIATGSMFLLISIFQLPKFEFSIFYFLFSIFSFYVVSSLIVIFAYDLKHYIIPDKVLFPAIGISFIYRFLGSFQISNFKFEIVSFGSYIFAALMASGFFLLIYLISQGRWMGFGDCKLAILLGLILGFPKILLALFLAFLFGAIIGIILLLLRKKKLKSEVPFAPFLITGALLSMFWGQTIINLYFRFLGV